MENKITVHGPLDKSDIQKINAYINNHKEKDGFIIEIKPIEKVKDEKKHTYMRG